jgi:choline dehydrogenase-like flavoprotein
VRPPGHGITIGVVLLQPKSRGSVTLRSANPLDAPRIDPRYLTDPDGDDMRLLAAGTKLAHRVMRSPALASFAGEPMVPDRELGSDAEIEALVREKAESLYHPVGTCRMGTDELAVVDAHLRVRGLQGLRVVDASVMPQIIRGHTNSPTVMIAERAVGLMKGELGGGGGESRAFSPSPSQLPLSIRPE